MKYSDDRLSLAQEIAEVLRSRNHWVPKDFAGPDLISAIGMALGTKRYFSAINLSTNEIICQIPICSSVTDKMAQEFDQKMVEYCENGGLMTSIEFCITEEP